LDRVNASEFPRMIRLLKLKENKDAQWQQQVFRIKLIEKSTSSITVLYFDFSNRTGLKP